MMIGSGGESEIGFSVYIVQFSFLSVEGLRRKNTVLAQGQFPH
jgi:hypothetical protein